MTLKKSKIEALVNHITEGGASDPDTVSNVVGIDIEDTETLAAYIARAKKDLPQASPTFTGEITGPFIYQLRGSDGIIRDLDLVKQKGNLVILEVPVVRDLVDVLIKGEMITVDLEILKGLDHNALHAGVLVSKLLAAAELAKG